MSKKVKLEFTGQELMTFNQVWQLPELDTPTLRIGTGDPKAKKMDKMALLMAQEMAIKFLKKAVDRRIQKNAITLKEHEAIALVVYLDLYLDYSDSQDTQDVYLDALIRKYYRILDQKTV